MTTLPNMSRLPTTLPTTTVADGPPTVLSTDEAAAYLRLSPHTLELWRRQKKGPAHIKAGHRVVYLERDLVSWLMLQRVEAP